MAFCMIHTMWISKGQTTLLAFNQSKPLKITPLLSLPQPHISLPIPSFFQTNQQLKFILPLYFPPPLQFSCIKTIKDQNFSSYELHITLNSLKFSLFVPAHKLLFSRMASVSLGFTNSLILLKPRSTSRKPRIFQSNYSQVIRNRFRVRAGLREDNGSASAAVGEEREREVVTQLNGSVNGRAQSNGSYTLDKVLEGGGGLRGEKDGENGVLVKYLNGSGNGVVEVEKVKEKKKKSVEEIGQEDAWFKQNVNSNKVEVVSFDNSLILRQFALRNIYCNGTSNHIVVV